MIPFAQRAQEMGLDVSSSYKGLYSYEDRYSKVVYRELGASEPHLDPQHHPTDGAEVPMIGVWTAPPQANDYRYVGYVSNIYKFVGNELIIDRVRNALEEVGTPILKIATHLLYDLTAIREEIVLRSSLSSPQAGDINPVMIIGNSYNGTKAATVAFGIAVDGGEIIGQTIFGFSLGEMKMIHIASNNTRLSSGINQYLEVFNNHILDMIDRSFNTILTQDQMFGTLDVIEKYGKKRRKQITDILTSMQPPPREGQPPALPSAWQVFLSITRYCALEPNLNMKRLLENIAESVLVVPTRMYEVLNHL
jgi:hypothetical protein